MAKPSQDEAIEKQVVAFHFLAVAFTLQFDSVSFPVSAVTCGKASRFDTEACFVLLLEAGY